ncbi:DNA polymerase III subunit delta' [Candidatus Poribacteria bacterium]|nr:DNA polymerase III subunit delta' [Candidatus Poribacteria bacterium]
MLDDVMGHGSVVKSLKNALRSKKIANSYLFSGLEGIGKEFVALNFAKALNCNEVDDDCCDKCISCRKINDGNHADVMIIRPAGTRLKIDQMRVLQRQGSYRAVEGNYKVYMITQAEKMTAEAANSILKILEEPPGLMVLILLTSIYTAILPTIRSRCHSLKFNPIPLNLLRDELVSRMNITESKAKWAALRSRGMVGKALELIKSDKDDSEDKLSKDLLRLSDGSRKFLLNIFKNAESLGKTENALDILISWYRDLLLVKQNYPEELLVHSDEIESLKKIASQYSDIQMENLIRNTIKIKYLIQRNINSNLALEVMMLHSFDNLTTRF